MYLEVARRIIRRMPLKAWWEESEGRTSRVFAISVLVAVVLGVLVLYSEIRYFLETHPWWYSTLAAVPGIVPCILAYRELAHSGKANVLRQEANDLRSEANRLRRRVAELEEEKAGHLKQIAQNTQRPVSQAERKASILRRHLGAKAAVSEGKGVWPSTVEIAEVNEEYLVALFSPRSPSSGAAWCVYVGFGAVSMHFCGTSAFRAGTEYTVRKRLSFAAPLRIPHRIQEAVIVVELSLFGGDAFSPPWIVVHGPT